MRFFGETHFDFLGVRRWAYVLSGALILAGLASLVIKGGPRLGIDFAGGSQMVARFAVAPDLAQLRAALIANGLEDSQIQEFQGDNEVLIRTPRVEETEEADVVARINRSLESVDPRPADSEQQKDLNTVGTEEIVSQLLDANPLELDTLVDLEGARVEYRRVVDSILAIRASQGLLSSWDEVSALEIDPRISSTLQEKYYLGGHALVNTEWVGPQVGRDLRRQAMQAMAWALLGLLAYISYRFEFRYGVAAVLALVHDVLISLGAFSVTNREFNLPVIAAFLTIVGYSLNDTVVVFDRIRENNQLLRRVPLHDRINASVNQTLSRTVLTSTTTLLVVLSLYLYGGPVINNFAFALLVGVAVGTYSSVFVASPIVYVWHTWASKRAKRR